MRTHAQILQDATVAKVRRELAERGRQLPDATVRAWGRRPNGIGNIPPNYWPYLVDAGLTSLEELAAKHRPDQSEAA